MVAKRTKEEVNHNSRAPIPWAVLLLFSSAFLLLLVGWRLHYEHYLTAESGVGYALGIIGGTMMLLLLLYPLRKRFRFMLRLGAVRFWFRLHMFFGIFGPIAILYHASFQSGSLNSTVALFAMLIVAGSGLFGRFFYTKIHMGLYGKRATFEELKACSTESLTHLSQLTNTLPPDAAGELQRFEARALAPSRGIIHGLGRAIRLAFTTRHTYHRLHYQLTKELTKSGLGRAQLRPQIKELKHFLRGYLFTLRKVAELSFYECLFSWWHILHLPLFIMLIISGITHVLAVHMY